MRINQNITPTLNLFDSLMKLAESIDNCISKEACYTILLSEENYKTVYRETEILAFRERSLLLFIRSRIALFQIDFIWFQKETIALINLWLAQEEQFKCYFSQVSKNQLIKILCFGINEHPIRFVDFFEHEQTFDNYPLDQLMNHLEAKPQSITPTKLYSETVFLMEASSSSFRLNDFLTNLKGDKLQFLEMAQVVL